MAKESGRFLLTGSDSDPDLPRSQKYNLGARQFGSISRYRNNTGAKHLRELMALLPQSRAVMLYFINRGDCAFAPGDTADPSMVSCFARLLRKVWKFCLVGLRLRHLASATWVWLS